MLSSQKTKVQFALYLTEGKKVILILSSSLGEDGIELDYPHPLWFSHCIVKDGDVVSLGARLTEGSINPS